MTPILPREMLWTDLETMDEFFKLDPINESFFEVFVTLREEPFAIKADEVKVFNEVYYQLTRMMFEYPMPSDLPKYINDIKANMGWNYSAELVMSMAYFIFSLIDKNERHVNKFFTKAVNEKYFGCLYWKPFKHCFEKQKKEKRQVKFSFHPRPMGLDWLKGHYIHWNKVTNDYDLICIEKVINLWSDIQVKHDVAVMINDSISYYSTKRNAADLAHLKHFMEVYLIADESASIWKSGENSFRDECKLLKGRVEELDKEKIALQQRLIELESENKRLNALLEKKKKNGTARKFTLVQIVDYCKGCVVWDDAKSIVAMLNKLLRRIATEEDSDLVDSIEAEFMYRKYGDTYIKEQTVIPSVGNYKPQITTQNIEAPMPSIGQQQEQKQLEDE